MRRFLTVLGATTLSVALVLGSSPAHAGEFGWADPAGDANGFSSLETTPRPSEPELDITKVTYSTNGKELNVVWALTKAVGEPAGSIGRDFDFYFTHDGHKYSVGAQLPMSPLEAALLAGPVFTNNDGAQAVRIECGCKLKIDGKANTMTFTVSYTDLDRAFPGTGKVGPGTTFTDMRGRSARIQGALLVPVDLTAPAPDSAFTF